MVPCSGSAVTFRVSPGITGARYQWRINGAVQQTELPTLQYTFPPSASQYEALINVEVTPPDIPCAGKTVRELRLTLYPSLTLTCPEADFAISGDSVQYKAEVSGGQPPYQHLWVIGSDTLRGPDRRAVQYRFAEAGKYNIFLRVTDSRGCQTSCGLEQDVTRPLLFPNVFTPDGRGSNETFTVQYAGSNFEMNIYNRWGKLVATTGDGIKGWDGSGSASGVYFYIIRIGSREYKGWVHLLR
jgi:gliding motility-associated-like protein